MLILKRKALQVPFCLHAVRPLRAWLQTGRANVRGGRSALPRLRSELLFPQDALEKTKRPQKSIIKNDQFSPANGSDPARAQELEPIGSQGQAAAARSGRAVRRPAAKQRTAVRTDQPVLLRKTALRRPGGHCGEPPPDPIPNSAVKLPSANGTAS